MGEQSEQQRFAVLIDGDNAQASLLPQILAEVSKVGLITIKRIYGDWTTTSMNSWKESLHKYAIQPIQQFRYTVGKNATDSAMIIDAMDLLHTNDVDGFCIVASLETFRNLGYREMPGVGIHTVTIPGTLDGWCSLLDKYGTMSLAQVLAPAIELAEYGFPVTEVIGYGWKK
ncbi:unnamed protein product, partial [marine sediment metagenome]